MIVVFSFLAAALPSMLLLRWFRNSDQFPEPWPVVRKVFWRGVWVVAPVLMIADPLKMFQPQDEVMWAALYEAFVLAAIPEEFFKYFVLVFFCLRLKEFDEPMDGIVYGVTVSLGFATFENVLYVMDGGLGVAVMRALTSVPAHAMTGAIMGYFIACSMIEPANKLRAFILAFFVPTLLHGAYDFPLMYLSGVSENAVGDLSSWMVPMFLLVIAIQWRLAMRYKKRLRAHQVLVNREF